MWRELRRVGAVSLGPSVWALPAASAFADSLDRVGELAAEGNGSVITLDSTPHDPVDQVSLIEAFNSARSSEWTEFRSECAKYLAEISHEHSIAKYTLAELDEEEQSLDKLRRWSRELRGRDVFTVDEAAQAEKDLSHCIDALAEYAEHVYRIAHSSIPAPDAQDQP